MRISSVYPLFWGALAANLRYSSLLNSINYYKVSHMRILNPKGLLVVYLLYSSVFSVALGADINLAATAAVSARGGWGRKGQRWRRQ